MTGWVSDASPLIFLAKLDRLPILERAARGRVWVPPVVVDEVSAGDDNAAAGIAEALGSWLQMREPRPTASLRRLQRDLGAGEAASIALALELRSERIVLDDLAARRWARGAGCAIVGTIGLLLAARLRREIPSLAAEIEHLRRAGFRISPALTSAVLDAAGER